MEELRSNDEPQGEGRLNVETFQGLGYVEVIRSENIEDPRVVDLWNMPGIDRIGFRDGPEYVIMAKICDELHDHPSCPNS